MINFRNLSNQKQNNITFNKNLQRDREALSKIPKHNYPQSFYENIEKQKEILHSPLQSKSAKENEKIIKIDDFIFSVFHNIESIDYELSLGITKVESLSKNYYLKLGGNEERVSFEAKIFVEYLSDFNGFIDKIKARSPLSFSTMESAETRKILIDKFSAKTKDWLMDSSRNMTFHTKEFSISGIIL